MIIKRKYVRLKKLYMTDPASKAEIDMIYTAPQGMEEAYKERWRYNTRTTMFNVPFGVWASIPNAGDLWEAFERLDKEQPYDNGMTMQDVEQAKLLGYKKDGTAIVMLCDKNGNAISVGSFEPAAAGGEIDFAEDNFVKNYDMFPD